MPFCLKNVGATYERLVNKMFAEKLDKTMEVYVDDMLVESLQSSEYIRHLKHAFLILGRYRMQLNQSKCAFRVAFRKFLGFMVHRRGLRPIPKKIQTLLDMKSPAKVKDIKRLIGCIASLNRFIAPATDRCLPFFKVLKKGAEFAWIDDCEQSF